MTRYNYLGDRLTNLKLKNKTCQAVKRNKKCIRSRMGTMLVEFNNNEKHIVLARRLRKIDNL